MSASVDLYNNVYADFAGRAEAAVRHRALGEDIGQSSWMTAADWLRFADSGARVRTLAPSHPPTWRPPLNLVWPNGRGYATQALRLLLPHARAEGLAYIELTTDAANVASRRVIEANGGVLIERFHKPIAYGGAESLRFRIDLADGTV